MITSATPRPTKPPRFWWRVRFRGKGGAMPGPRKHPNELHERAQQMVAKAISQDPALSMLGKVIRIGPRMGVVQGKLRG